jgi:hypothetical protein
MGRSAGLKLQESTSNSVGGAKPALPCELTAWAGGQTGQIELGAARVVPSDTATPLRAVAFSGCSLGNITDAVLVPGLEETTIGAGAQEEAETTAMGSRSGAPGAPVVLATTGEAVHSSRRPVASAAYEKPDGNEGIAERTLPAEAAWALTDDASGVISGGKPAKLTQHVAVIGARARGLALHQVS